MPSLVPGFLRAALFRVVKKVVGKVAALPVRRRLNKFEAATHSPREVQEAVLRDILAVQAQTGYGRDHGFATIRTVEDFRHQVPVAGYEGLEPYIQRVIRGETEALLSDPKVHMFALTSGTTATRKYIPVTDRYLADYRRGWNLWGLKAYRDHRDVWLRPIVQVSGDWQESFTERGVPCGAVTGLTATTQKRIIRWLYCVPPIVGKIKDAHAKYYTVLRLSLPQSVGMMVAANPSTLINLARAGDQCKGQLIKDLFDGTLDPDLDIPLDVRAALAPRLKKHRQRALELQGIAARLGHLYPRDYWPRTCLLGNWTGGSAGTYLHHYPKYFGDHPVRDVGLIASEGRMTIPVDTGTPAGILDIQSHYFEFIPEAEGDSSHPTVLAAHELREGEHYYILLTTGYGLYRYHIRDVVRVAGLHNQTPLLEFLSKGAHFANITGEKLSEYHVTGAMQEVLRDLDLTLSSYSVAPCWPAECDEELPYYGLFVEEGEVADRSLAARLAEHLDDRLCRVNVEYESKRSTGRLGPVRLTALPRGFWPRWDRERLLRSGGSLEQYKHPCLINDPRFGTEVALSRSAAMV
jgi:hypothetical protein